jgi:hypothetical protein
MCAYLTILSITVTIVSYSQTVMLLNVSAMSQTRVHSIIIVVFSLWKRQRCDRRSSRRRWPRQPPAVPQRRLAEAASSDGRLLTSEGDSPRQECSTCRTNPAGSVPPPPPAAWRRSPEPRARGSGPRRCSGRRRAPARKTRLQHPRSALKKTRQEHSTNNSSSTSLCHKATMMIKGQTTSQFANLIHCVGRRFPSSPALCFL